MAGTLKHILCLGPPNDTAKMRAYRREGQEPFIHPIDKDPFLPEKNDFPHWKIINFPGDQELFGLSPSDFGP